MIENRLTKLFAGGRRSILSIYFTGGYPELSDTGTVLEALGACGVDLVEVGMPFSDSLVDGPTIQASNAQALKNGITLPLLFEQLAAVPGGSRPPLGLMSCFNPVLQFGVERFLRRCGEVGVDGVILPDLPLEEYLNSYQQRFEEAEVSVQFLVTERTPVERIRLIDRHSRGFIYAVSGEAVTGGSLELDASRQRYFRRLEQLELSNPVMVGFGISGREEFEAVCARTRGAIIGSAFIRALQSGGPLGERIESFVRAVRPQDGVVR